jgi:dTDP-4-dehydrorhamnose reductase
MPRIAILGANGQVGAELCLLLSRIVGVDLIPVCRNPTGSAFLRFSGLPCRHGRPADASEAPRLIGDCDAIVNCALGAGTPAAIRAFDRKLIRNVFACSKPSAVIIHCSTLMVHGDPRPGKVLRTRDSYGGVKLAAEADIRSHSKRTGKPAYILRLGHVCGQLQNITDKIRKEIATERVLLPREDVYSNTVYTVTIVDALLSILAGKNPPGVFDLTNSPQWTWRQVYEYEAALTGHALSPKLVSAPAPRSGLRSIAVSIKQAARRWAGSPFVRSSIERALAVAPKEMNDKAQATWFQMRARAEIAAITAEPALAPELSWIRLDRRPMSGLRETATLLQELGSWDLSSDVRTRWPRDLRAADAESTLAKTDTLVSPINPHGSP